MRELRSRQAGEGGGPQPKGPPSTRLEAFCVNWAHLDRGFRVPGRCLVFPEPFPAPWALLPWGSHPPGVSSQAQSLTRFWDAWCCPGPAPGFGYVSPDPARPPQPLEKGGYRAYSVGVRATPSARCRSLRSRDWLSMVLGPAVISFLPRHSSTALASRSASGSLYR